MGMSLADLLSSLSYVLGSVAFPESAGGRGNQATCNGTFCVVPYLRVTVDMLRPSPLPRLLQ